MGLGRRGAILTTKVLSGPWNRSVSVWQPEVNEQMSGPEPSVPLATSYLGLAVPVWTATGLADGRVIELSLSIHACGVLVALGLMYRGG